MVISLLYQTKIEARLKLLKAESYLCIFFGWVFFICKFFNFCFAHFFFFIWINLRLINWINLFRLSCNLTECMWFCFFVCVVCCVEFNYLCFVKFFFLSLFFLFLSFFGWKKKLQNFFRWLVAWRKLSWKVLNLRFFTFLQGNHVIW